MDLLSSSTLSNVDKFVESQMRAIPIGEIKDGMELEGNKKYAAKFTVDGYGKWREIRREQDTPDGTIDIYKRLLHSKEIGEVSPFSRLDSICSSPNTNSQKDFDDDSRSAINLERPCTSSSGQSYKHLSTSLRSNVFPGVGKDKWQSSTKTTYNTVTLPASWKKPKAHFAITKDDYMDWAEHDVYRQRLVKAWDKYIADAPKPERQVPLKKRTKQVENHKKEPKKLQKKKSKEKKGNVNAEKEVTQNDKQKDEIQTRRIEVKPANSDDDFWDFYEKPFAQ